MADQEDKQKLNQQPDSQDQQQQQEGGEQELGIMDGVKGLVKPTAALWKILIFEFVGTMIFAHGINSSNGSDFLVALSLFAALILTCKHSGGHINPAVSTGFLCLDHNDKAGNSIDIVQWFSYVVAQVLGAFVGGYLAQFVLGEASAPWIAKQEINWMIADVLGEFLGTFTFVITILIMADKRTTYNTQTIYILLTIAAALFFSRQFSVHSGGCLNPAIAIGLETMMWLSSGDSKYLRRSYVFIIGPICGAVAAGCFFRYFWLPKKIAADQEQPQQQQPVQQEAN